MVAVAIIGSAVVGAGASAVAAGSASRTASRNNAANNQIQENVRNENRAVFAPYQAQGQQATSAIGALLGFSTAPAFSQGGKDYYVGADGKFSNEPPATGQQAAFDTFRNSTGYQDQFNEGQRAVTSALGNRGMLDSGAAIKAQTRYGQSQANQSFADYYNRIFNQQQVGANAAAAQAGVSTNYGNAVNNNNNAAAEVKSNAALSIGNSVNSALSQGLSAYTYSQGLKSSYGAKR